MKLSLEEVAGESDVLRIERGLTEHAEESGVEPRNHRQIAVLLRDGDGRLAGGLTGDTVWGWLQIKLLWVAAEHRGRGYGAQLLAAAEEEARRRGCHHALLDTFDFQARGLYERLGYEVFGTLGDFPRGHQRFFLRKNLAVPGAKVERPLGPSAP
jgi:GNAT superfamily N-acetyltransferase